MAVRAEALIRFFGILWLSCVCNSANGGEYPFLKEASDAAAKAHYDYIIVGGGTAGCPLAATLSQNFSVLLLERGGSPYGNPNITRIENLHRNFYDSADSPSQAFVSEDGVISARARVLGGGSCINAGFYSRASLLEWRELGFDFRLVKQSYAWVEDVVAHKPAFNEWQSAVRGGLLEAGISPDNGFTYDHVYGTKLGGTTFNETGDRSTAADLLRYANPRKLTVLLRATVQRLLFKGGSNPRARGVIFRDAEGSKHVAYLKTEGGTEGEIILSAGALGSPQLLMLSGIGPAGHLRALGIPVVLDQPLVGQGMGDNPMNAIVVPSPVHVDLSLIQVAGIPKFGSFIEASSGFGVSSQGYFQGGSILEKVRGRRQGSTPADERRRGGQSDRQIQLLRGPAGFEEVHPGSEDRCEGHNVAALQKIRVPGHLDGPAHQHDVAGSSQPPPPARQRQRLSGAAVQGHRVDHLALPRRLPGRTRRRPELSRRRRGPLARRRRVHVALLSWHQPPGQRYDARQVHGSPDAEREIRARFRGVITVGSYGGRYKDKSLPKHGLCIRSKLH